MLELNNYYIQDVENLTDLFTIIFTIVDDIYNDIIPISIRNRRNIKDSKLCDSEIITTKYSWWTSNYRFRKIIFKFIK